MVEIKGFENMASPVDYLAHVIGQYMLYSIILEALSNPTPLYLAVPLPAYQGFLGEAIGQDSRLLRG